MTPAAVTAPYVSKSRFLQGLQCPKLLWSVYNAPHLIPAPDQQTQAIFDQGKVVGDLAKRLFPGGIEIKRNVEADNFGGILTDTQRALTQRRALYEAGFLHNSGFVRVDILNPIGDDAWELVEVKSTTEVEDIHLHDLAFQVYVLTGAGLKIQRCILTRINAAFVKNGPIDPQHFFVLKDVTAQVFALTHDIESKLAGMFGTIQRPQAPEVQIGRHCHAPYTCPLQSSCWNFLPEADVTTLYRGKSKGFKLLVGGITSLKNIPENFPLTDNQRIQRHAAITGEPHVDKAAIKAFLSQFQYPVSYLDFETFSTAIPMFDGTRPYTQVPFQFSLHIVCSPGAEPEHHTFLADGTNDPRPEFMHRLRAVLPDQGSIVVYNAQFELSRLKECSDLMPDCRSWTKNIHRRIIDLLLSFRGFRYYHPKQAGSASMKSVLPAITGRGYEHLVIQDGSTASTEFLRAEFGKVSAEERAKIRERLDHYCQRDTEGMLWIVDSLGTLSR